MARGGGAGEQGRAKIRDDGAPPLRQAALTAGVSN